MKVVVAAKRVIDHAVRIQVRADGSGVETGNVKMSMNPFDEIAVEQAIRLKETGVASEVIVVSVGSDAAVETIRAALAMGADRGILIKTGGARVEPLAVAKILATLVVEEGAGLALLGKQAIDDDSNQTGQMLAALLGWPQATFASALTIADGKAEVSREVDSGTQTVSLDLPAVVTADLRLNTPRYASLPNIMKARSKPIAMREAAELGVDLTPRLTVVSTSPPAARKSGVKVGSVDELVQKLRSEAGVLS
jgi:electron transfer flavoprotein beta subunit